MYKVSITQDLQQWDDISEYVSAVSWSESVDSPWARADISLTNPPFESTPGDYIRISHGDACLCLGYVRDINMYTVAHPDGVVTHQTALSCGSWFHVAAHAEFKLTPNKLTGDLKNLRGVQTHTKTNDESIPFYLNEIYTKAASGAETAELLRDALILLEAGRDISQLLRIPDFATNIDYRFEDKLLDVASPYNHGVRKASFSWGQTLYGHLTSTQDYIPGYIPDAAPRLYRMTNTPLWGIISNLFQALPIVEVFPTFAPLLDDDDFSIPDNRYVRLSNTRHLLRRPCMVYRFAPINPAVSLRESGGYYAEVFRGVLDAPAFQRWVILPGEQIISVNHAMTDSDRQNTVFLRDPWAKEAATRFNLWGIHSTPVINPEDVNQYGLRSFDGRNPYQHKKLDKQNRVSTQANLEGASALAERIYLTTGDGHLYSKGSITMTTSIELLNLPAGVWFTVPLGDRGDQHLRGYIQEKQHSVTVLPDGSEEERTEIRFVRGSLDSHIPLSFTPKIMKQANVRAEQKKARKRRRGVAR